eukprot:s379_g20.t1
MAIDSKVAFQNRALELGVDQADVDALATAGINSYATYAYCSTYQPGQNDDAALIQFLTDALGAAPNAAATSRFRRLFFEAHALSLEDLKSRADRSESSEARVIPLAEKMDRIRLQKARLVGISFTAQTEPSHNLIDRVCQQLEDNVVSYIELQKCTSRQDETLHAKVDQAVSLDTSGGLRLSKKQKLDDINVTGEHRLRQAFLRRALAYDLSGIGTFAVMDLWTQKLFEKMNETPVANYKHISVEQVINADKALWVKISNDTRGKLQTKTGEDRAFDKSFEKFCEHPEVLQHLTPLQVASSSRGEPSHMSYQGGKGKGSQQSDTKGKASKGKGKGPGIVVPDDCEIFVDGKQLCKRWQVGKCHMGPRPLRDASNLMGLPGLQGADTTKVELSNRLYNAAILLLMLCFTLGCLVSIENPARSWLWQLLAFLVHQTGHEAFITWYSKLESVYFDACAHGSSRDKRTKLLCSPGLLTGLAADCPGDHQHASWQPYQSNGTIVFPTAQEAEYPALLCNRMADCVQTAAAQLDVTPEFLQKAEKVMHPMDQESFLHEATKTAIRKVVHTDPVALAKERLATVYRLRKLTDELRESEQNLKKSLHPDVRQCVNSKNISLFKYLLETLDFWDMGVIGLLCEGVPLVGLQDQPNGYQGMLVPASITEDELATTAPWRRRSLMESRKSASPEEENALLDATAEEVSRGFLGGPYSESEISVLLETDDWSLNPRFVLFQGSNNKVRVIDDAKQSAVNSAYTSTVKLQLQDVDYAAAMVVFLMHEVSQSRFKTGRWLGKTFDLSKAYKQLAVFPGHQKHAIVGFPVKGSWRFYKSFSLPFGCTGSVYGFVRISQAIWFIVTRLLFAVTSHYFDDFPTLERAEGCRILSLAFSAVLDMLGWVHAKEGDKALNFAEAFDLLGVTFNLTSIPSGLLEVSNKVSRIEKLCQLLDQISSEGAISISRASEIQGLLNFAVGYYTGKSLKHLVSAFMPFAEVSHHSKQRELQALCSYAKLMLTTLKPRREAIGSSSGIT